jgi:uncharacterized membrane protein YedE/YeeE
MPVRRRAEPSPAEAESRRRAEPSPAEVRAAAGKVQLPIWSVVIFLAVLHYFLWVYRKAGEQLNSVASQEVPLEQATSASQPWGGAVGGAGPAARIPRSWGPE